MLLMNWDGYGKRQAYFYFNIPSCLGERKITVDGVGELI